MSLKAKPSTRPASPAVPATAPTSADDALLLVGQLFGSRGYLRLGHGPSEADDPCFDPDGNVAQGCDPVEDRLQTRSGLFVGRDPRLRKDLGLVKRVDRSRGIRGRLERNGRRGRIGLGERGCRGNETGRQESTAEREIADRGAPAIWTPRIEHGIDPSGGIRSRGPREGGLTPQRSSYKCRRATLPSSR